MNATTLMETPMRMLPTLSYRPRRAHAGGSCDAVMRHAALVCCGAAGYISPSGPTIGSGRQTTIEPPNCVAVERLQQRSVQPTQPVAARSQVRYRPPCMLSLPRRWQRLLRLRCLLRAVRGETDLLSRGKWTWHPVLNSESNNCKPLPANPSPPAGGCRRPHGVTCPRRGHSRAMTKRPSARVQLPHPHIPPGC